MAKYQENQEIHGGWHSTDEGIQEAKDFISEMGLSAEDVGLRRRNGFVHILVLREIDIEIK